MKSLTKFLPRLQLYTIKAVLLFLLVQTLLRVVFWLHFNSPLDPVPADDLVQAAFERALELEESRARLAEEISQRKDLEAQFIQAQKMEAVGRLAGGVAHDFNNLLTVILATVELVIEDLRDKDPLLYDIQQIREAGRRAEALELKPDGVFMSNGPGDPEPVSYAVEAAKELIDRLRLRPAQPAVERYRETHLGSLEDRRGHQRA